MKIAVISTFLTDYHFELVTRFAMTADVLFLHDSDKAAREIDPVKLGRLPARARVRRFRQSRIWWRWLAVAKSLWDLLNFRPNIVIGHEHAHPHITWIYRIAAALAPFTLIVHDPAPHVGRDAEFYDRNVAQIRRQRGLASVLVAHGTFCSDLLRSLLPDKPERVVSIQLGANFGPAIPTPVPHARRILMFGRMEEYKGLDLLLETITDLRGRRDDFVLVLAGRGPSLDEYRTEFEALDCCEVISEYISRERSEALFNGCDVVVAPYHEATQSGVISLANAFGRPVIGMAVGGLPDVVAEGVNGRLVPKGDCAALSAALEDALYTPGELDRLADGARAVFTHSLSWDVIAAEFLRQFEVLVLDAARK